MGSINTPGRDTLYDSLLKKVSNVDGKLPAFDQIDFSPEERDRFEKLSFIDDLVRRKLPILKLSDVYKLYSLKYEDSNRQFYRLYHETQQLFGSMSIRDKQYQKSIYVRWFEEAASIAFKMGDMKGFTKCLTEAAKLQDLYTPIDLDKQMNEVPRTFIVALNVKLPDGAMKSKYINLDTLEKLQAGEFRELADQVNSIEYSMEDMEAQLNKSDPA